MISFFRRALSSCSSGPARPGHDRVRHHRVRHPSGSAGSARGDAIAKVDGEAVTATEVTDRLNRQFARRASRSPRWTSRRWSAPACSTRSSRG